MLINSFKIKKSGIINNNNVKQIYYKGIQKMQNDTFEKKSSFNYFVQKIENDEYEGFLVFKTSPEASFGYKAYYVINDAGNPPLYKTNDGFNAKLTIDYIDVSEKMPKDTETYLKQDDNKYSTKTESVFEIIKHVEDGIYEAKVQGFKDSIYVDIDEITDYKPGDKVLASGALRVDFD